MKLLRILSIGILGTGILSRVLADSLPLSAEALPSGAPTDTWLQTYEPEMMTPAQRQALYTTLIRGYWVPKNGLFLSFPGSGDQRLTQQAALYDQGIAGILLLALGDTPRVLRMLRFFEQTWDTNADARQGPLKGVHGLSNFYNAYYGVEGIEKTIHVGPNAWIGLLASRAYRRTGDAQSLELALKIAHWMIESIPHARGAIAMGPVKTGDAPWPEIFSTENNLSTYSFMNDLLKVTTLSDEDRAMITKERDGIGHWLLTGAYDASTQHVTRGFNPQKTDTGGAIDSYTWYTDALQPAAVRDAGISIETLVQIAEHDYTVVVDGRHGVDCVDGAMAQQTFDANIAHPAPGHLFSRPAGDDHRLIWYEGTGQFIVFLEDVAHDAITRAAKLPDAADRTALLSNAKKWLDEAKSYTTAMDDASISLPWGKTYPCATGGQFYVYGWPSPAPSKDHPSDASAALIWRMYAGLSFEPLTDRWLSGTHVGPVHTTVHGNAGSRGSGVLYGASQEMTARAWKLLDRKDYAGARAQAQATISEWESYARDLQKKKETADGGFIVYDKSPASFQSIVNYWALNDVAACYFILGRSNDLQGHTDEAVKDFHTILHEYSLAQVWDVKGWFWSPIDAVKSDYIQAKSKTYGSLLQEFPRWADAKPKP